MGKFLVMFLSVAALRAEVIERKIPPEGVTLSREEQRVFDRIEGGDFSLLHKEEMNRYLIALHELKPGLRSAEFCLNEFDEKERLAEEEKNRDIAEATRGERKSLDIEPTAGFGGRFSSWLGGGNDSTYRSPKAQTQVAFAIDDRKRDKAKAVEMKKDCLADAKRYRQTMIYYYTVEKSDPERQSLPNPRRQGGDSNVGGANEELLTAAQKKVIYQRYQAYAARLLRDKLRGVVAGKQ